MGRLSKQDIAAGYYYDPQSWGDRPQMDLAYVDHDKHEIAQLERMLAAKHPGEVLFVLAVPGSRTVMVESRTAVAALRTSSCQFLPWTPTIKVTWAVCTRAVILACQACSRLGGMDAVAQYLAAGGK